MILVSLVHGTMAARLLLFCSAGPNPCCRHSCLVNNNKSLTKVGLSTFFPNPPQTYACILNAFIGMTMNIISYRQFFHVCTDTVV